MRVSFFVELLVTPVRLRSMKHLRGSKKMVKLEELKEKVNKAYAEALNCPCYLRKRQLLKKFYEMNSLYNEHKQWIATLSS